MKQTSLFIILLFLLGCNNDKTSKNNLEQSKDTLVESNILKQDIYSGNLVLKLKQDSSCCKSVKYPHGNIGVASFALMDSNRIAILCEESRLIKIYEQNSNKLLKEIKIAHSVNNIGFSDWTQCFYLSERDKLYEYSFRNDSLRIININKKIDGIWEYISLDSNLYVKTSKGNFLVMQNGNPISVEDQLNGSRQDIIINSETSVNYTKRLRSFEVNEYNSDTSYKYFINTKEESAHYRFIASLDKEFIFIKYLSQDKGKIFIGNYMTISKKDKSISIYSELPNIYYTSIFKSFEISEEKLYHLISTPYSILVFEIQLDKLKKFSYPDSLNYNFHFNRDM